MILVKTGDCRDQMENIASLAEKSYFPNRASSVQRYLSLYNVCQSGFITAYDHKGYLIGFIVLVPIKNKFFENVISPSFDERSLGSYAVNFASSENSMYLFALAIDPSIKNKSEVLKGLGGAVSSLLGDLSKKGIKIYNVCAIAQSESDILIFENLKMSHLGNGVLGKIFASRNFGI